MKIQRPSPAPRPLPSAAEPPSKPKTVVEQNADFTAEGSPPPGKVGTEVPAKDAGVTPLRTEGSSAA